MTSLGETSNANSMLLRKTTREEFVAHLTKEKQDKFAHTFVAKCDMIDAWDNCMGVWIYNKLAGAIVTTISKRQPKTANLQLLHTFYEFRGRGVGKLLCEYSLQYAFENKAEYFRVSADKEAVDFYPKLGVQYVGRQKSGSHLSMFKIQSPIFKENDYLVDSTIYKEMSRKGKGGCVVAFKEYKGVDLFTI